MLSVLLQPRTQSSALNEDKYGSESGQMFKAISLIFVDQLPHRHKWRTLTEALY